MSSSEISYVFIEFSTAYTQSNALEINMQRKSQELQMMCVGGLKAGLNITELKKPLQPAAILFWTDCSAISRQPAKRMNGRRLFGHWSH